MAGTLEPMPSLPEQRTESELSMSLSMYRCRSDWQAAIQIRHRTQSSNGLTMLQKKQKAAICK